MSQLTHKAKSYRDQRYKDRGVPRSLYQRTAFHQDNTMVTTLTSADYFDALDRLPDPTYGETSAERLASIVAMAGSLTEEDRALVIYDPRARRPFSRHSHTTSSAILSVYRTAIHCLTRLHEVDVPRRSDHTRVHRRPARQGHRMPQHHRRPIGHNLSLIHI